MEKNGQSDKEREIEKKTKSDSRGDVRVIFIKKGGTG